MHSRAEERTAAAYLAVVQDFAVEQERAPFCLNPVLSYRDAQPVPTETREALTRTGFEFVRVDEPPDTSVRVLTMFPIEGTADSLQLTVDLMGTSITRGSVRGWSYAWDYVVHCGGPACEIIARISGEHADLVLDETSLEARAIRSGQGAKCPRE